MSDTFPHVSYVSPRFTDEPHNHFGKEHLLETCVEAIKERMLRTELALKHLQIDLSNPESVIVQKGMVGDGSMVGFDLRCSIRLKKISEDDKNYVCKQVFPYTHNETGAEPDPKFNDPELLEIRAVQILLAPGAEFKVESQECREGEHAWFKISVALTDLHSNSYITEIAPILHPIIPTIQELKA